jgi:hypothetical protein
MPTVRNRLAMPNVRASSATIGTTRGPSASSFIRLPRMRTKAIVVLISLPSAWSANAAVASSSGSATFAESLRRAAARRRGHGDGSAGSASRRSRRPGL